MKAFFVSIPHSGEMIPPEVSWLKGLSEPVVMCDVDRFVDELYLEVASRLGVPTVVSQWHRYVVDLNRLPEDIDADSVEGAKNPSGQFSTGLHWVKTTTGIPLMPSPMSLRLHESLIKNYYEPFHQAVRQNYKDFFEKKAKSVYQLDAHSMPSLGTSAHRDPGERRSEIVVSDFNGQSCVSEYKDLVIKAFQNSGFQVGYNWPYVGGRVTQIYGQPHKGQQALQVELRRDLYMDEITKRRKPEAFESVKRQISQALSTIYEGLPEVRT